MIKFFIMNGGNSNGRSHFSTELNKNRESSSRSKNCSDSSSSEEDSEGSHNKNKARHYKDYKTNRSKKSSKERKGKNPYISSSSDSDASSYEKRKNSRSRSRSRSKSSFRSNTNSRERRSHHYKYKNEHYKNEGRHRKSFCSDNEKKDPNSQKCVYPELDGPIIDYNQFFELQNCHHLNQEVCEKNYEEYKKFHESFHNKLFFNENKFSMWFKEKYDFQIKINLFYQKSIKSQLIAEKFQKQIMNQEFLGIRLEISENEIEFRKRESTGEININLSPFFGLYSEMFCIFIKDIPGNISLQDILNNVKVLKGFICISASEPVKSSNFSRYMWVSFDKEENCDNALQQLENLKIDEVNFNVSKIKNNYKNISITPPLSEGREFIDLENTKKLIQYYDKEKNIKENDLLIHPNSNQLIQLDLQILYLRRVHLCCYYGCEEFEDERILYLKYGPLFIRSNIRIRKEKMESSENTQTRIFESKLDKFVSDILIQQKYYGQLDQEFQCLKGEIINEKIVTIDKSKIKCAFCLKDFENFKDIFIHVQTGHNNEISLEISFRNYCSDPNRFNYKPMIYETKLKQRKVEYSQLSKQQKLKVTFY